MLGSSAQANAELPPQNRLSGIVNNLAKRIFNGERITYDPELLASTATTLLNAMTTGYGKSLSDVDYDTPDFNTLRKLTENVFQFSASKDFHILQDMTLALKDTDGKLRSFSDFQKEVDKMNLQYNGNWLRTEYNHAVAASQCAARWTEQVSRSQSMPYLQYQAVMDSNTRPEHAALNGVIKRIDSDFWDKYYPPNGWGCRCEVIQLPGKNHKETPDMDLKHCKVAPMFQVNVGKKGVIFPKGHPYFMSQCQRCNGAKLGLSNNYDPNNAQCQVCLLGQKECQEYIGDCLRQHYVQKANENIAKIKAGMTDDGVDIFMKTMLSQNLHIYKGSFDSIMSHQGNNELLLKWLSELDINKLNNFHYEGWAKNRPYKQGQKNYDPNNPNKKKHNDTQWFTYYSINIDGETLWVHVKDRFDIGETIYTIEKKKPYDLLPGMPPKYKKKH